MEAKQCHIKQPPLPGENVKPALHVNGTPQLAVPGDRDVSLLQ